MPRLIKVEYTKPYTLKLSFDDGVQGEIDCTPSRPGSVFQKFSDAEFFHSGKIDPVHNTIVRDDNLDIDGLGCYLSITGKDLSSIVKQ